MYSKNKIKQNQSEKDHASRIAEMDCIVCDAPGPSQVHEPEQGFWFISIPLCQDCHTGHEGWHGTRLRWSLRKMSELKAINETIRRLAKK